MKLFSPKYYKQFTCIADKCKHSCCIGWEIDVDDATLEAYQACTHCYGNEIRESIEHEETPHFRLAEGERCPHLNEKGLCKIILSLGEGYLCDLCREQPRFYHDTVRGKEVGLGMACEEASRLILNSDDYREMTVVDTLEDDEKKVEFDAVAHRERIFDLLSDRSIPYAARLQQIQDAYDVSLSIRTDEEWRALLEELEYLDDAHRSLFSCYSSKMDTSKTHENRLERAFAYFVYRHCSSACDEGELRAALGFALFCERLLASLAQKATEEDLIELARIVSEELEYSEENTDAIKFEFSF
ncbi:MAG: flagellin lysine-N-methylase [Clostridia bacterium]|nr:flagellin lysine-N-methylase [Clostridia bacterium]